MHDSNPHVPHACPVCRLPTTPLVRKTVQHYTHTITITRSSPYSYPPSRPLSYYTYCVLFGTVSAPLHPHSHGIDRAHCYERLDRYSNSKTYRDLPHAYLAGLVWGNIVRARRTGRAGGLTSSGQRPVSPPSDCSTIPSATVTAILDPLLLPIAVQTVRARAPAPPVRSASAVT